MKFSQNLFIRFFWNYTSWQAWKSWQKWLIWILKEKFIDQNSVNDSSDRVGGLLWPCVCSIFESLFCIYFFFFLRKGLFISYTGLSHLIKSPQISVSTLFLKTCKKGFIGKLSANILKSIVLVDSYFYKRPF